MKSRVLVVVFAGVALLFLFLLGFNFFYLRNRSKSVLPKMVTPVAEDGTSSGTEDGASVSDESVLTSFVPLLPTETLMSTLTVDFDGDTFDDQVVGSERQVLRIFFLLWDYIILIQIHTAVLPKLLRKFQKYGHFRIMP